ncbi:uncharacterized protein LOC144707485 [Wolffia australiana]
MCQNSPATADVIPRHPLVQPSLALLLRLPDMKSSVYSTDEFRMFSFKVRTCPRAYSHDWTECPFAHPRENARRRDPRQFHYSSAPCPEFRKGSCRRGDLCEYAHGVFECWLHPAQYRTRLCKDGPVCARRVCFFAHGLAELRPLPVAPANELHVSFPGSSARSSSRAGCAMPPEFPVQSSPELLGKNDAVAAADVTNELHVSFPGSSARSLSRAGWAMLPELSEQSSPDLGWVVPASQGELLGKNGAGAEPCRPGMDKLVAVSPSWKAAVLNQWQRQQRWRWGWKEEPDLSWVQSLGKETGPELVVNGSGAGNGAMDQARWAAWMEKLRLD